MSARRKNKRTRRSTRITPYGLVLTETTLVLRQYRGGTLHIVNIELGGNDSWVAFRVADLCREHIRNIRNERAHMLDAAQRHLDELGGDK